jgi:ABC-type transport system substrate-binding protein
LSKVRSIGGFGTSIVLALVLAACGGSSSSSSSSGGTPSSGAKTVTLAMGVPPDSLDPGFGYT